MSSRPNAIEENKAICRAFLNHVARREFAQASDMLADDVEWWLQGNLSRSGWRYGKEKMFDNLQKVLATNLDNKFGHLTAEEDRVAVEMVATGLLSNGRQYDNSYHYLFTIRDGIIIRCKEYIDTKHVHDAMLT